MRELEKQMKAPAKRLEFGFRLPSALDNRPPRALMRP
jgi:excinuclease UvrABC helicase subunit UvrB